MIDNKKMIAYMKSEYEQNKQRYEHMRRYYDGQHDIYKTYYKRKGTQDRATHINWVSKFIGEEIAYALNKPVSYISDSGNGEFEKMIKKQFEHFDLNHDQKLMRELEIYGKAYCLYYLKTYVDDFGEKHTQFCEKILNPTNAIAYCDEEGAVIRFIYFYKKKYDENRYYNVYYPDGLVEIYCNDVLIKTEKHYFKRVPAHVLQIEESETIYSKIKELNDDYNELVSNQQSLISEYKNAYLTVCMDKQNLSPDSQPVKDFIKAIRDDNAGIIFYPNPQAKPSWLIKQINDTAIKNQMDELKENLYAQSGHIDFNEKLSSNLSGVALQSRLTGLDQRVNMMINPVKNALYSRVYFLCAYLATLNKVFDPSDIKIEANIDIPTDTAARINEVVQAGDIISHRTKLERLPFVENPALEMQRIKEEAKDSEKISLDIVNKAYAGAGNLNE